MTSLSSAFVCGFMVFSIMVQHRMDWITIDIVTFRVWVVIFKGVIILIIGDPQSRWIYPNNFRVAYLSSNACHVFVSGNKKVFIRHYSPRKLSDPRDVIFRRIIFILLCENCAPFEVLDKYLSSACVKTWKRQAMRSAVFTHSFERSWTTPKDSGNSYQALMLTGE